MEFRKLGRSGLRSVRSRTATGSPTVPRSRRTRRSPAPLSTRGSPPSTPPTSCQYLGQSVGLGAEGRATGGPGPPPRSSSHGPGPQRPGPGPQAHHGVHRQLVAAAADRLRRPVPGAPLRPLGAAGGNHGGVRRRGPLRQGPLHRRVRVDRRPDPQRPRARRELRIPLVSSQPQYSMLWRVIEDEDRADLRGTGLGRLLGPPSPRRPHRQVRAGVPRCRPAARATDERGGATFVGRFLRTTFWNGSSS